MEKAGVACLSGAGFGKYGEGHLRFSYANSRKNITKALERIADVLENTTS
jgi:aspartate/methionine/tyrosine aminotransferase